MPLVICRACKSYAGKAIDYVTDKKKAERVITHGLDESRSLAQQFIDTAMLHGKGDTSLRVYTACRLWYSGNRR